MRNLLSNVVASVGIPISVIVYIYRSQREARGGKHLADVLSCILHPETRLPVSACNAYENEIIERDQICNAEGGSMLAVSTQP